MKKQRNSSCPLDNTEEAMLDLAAVTFRCNTAANLKIKARKMCIRKLTP